MMRTNLVLSLLAVGAVPAFVAVGCADSFEDCNNTLSCPEDFGDGDGDMGTGGSGDGDGDTGGSSVGGEGGADGDPCGACDGGTPACNEDEECVECTGDEHCSGDTPTCVEEVCVECGENVQCSDASASSCDEGACTSCVEDADCLHIIDLNVCETDAGNCVECTSSDDCGGNPCNPITNECSDFGNTQQACEGCDTDENCSDPEHFCVPMEYQTAPRAGGYCLKQAPDCTRPYMTLLTGRESLSGVQGQNYCGIAEELATCEAVRALIDGASCPGGENSECPESGICEDIGGTASNRCTYACDEVADNCPNSGPGATCGTTPNDFCGYVP